MSISIVSAAVGGGWTVFWVQLPVLVLAVAVIVVATTALWRARPEDVPRVFEAFAAAFGRRPRPPKLPAREPDMNGSPAREEDEGE